MAASDPRRGRMRTTTWTVDDDDEDGGAEEKDDDGALYMAREATSPRLLAGIDEIEVPAVRGAASAVPRPLLRIGDVGIR